MVSVTSAFSRGTKFIVLYCEFSEEIEQEIDKMFTKSITD